MVLDFKIDDVASHMRNALLRPYSLWPYEKVALSHDLNDMVISLMIKNTNTNLEPWLYH